MSFLSIRFIPNTLAMTPDRLLIRETLITCEIVLADRFGQRAFEFPGDPIQNPCSRGVRF